MSDSLEFSPGDAQWTKLRNKGLSDLFFFSSVILGYGTRVPMTEEAHRILCKIVERKTGNKMLDSAWCRKFEMPRATGKTTCITQAYLIQRICANRNISIMLANENEGTAKAILSEIKQQFEQNQLLRSLYPEVIPESIKETTWSALAITVNRSESRKEPTIFVVGVGGTKTGMHPDCLAPEQEIYTSRGLVRADQLRPGLRVLSHDGRFNVIQAVGSRPFDGELVGIRSVGADRPVWVTPEHKLLVRRLHDGLPRVEWTPAGEITAADMLVSPQIPAKAGSRRLLGLRQGDQNELLSHPETWWALGLWVAEGCATEQKNLVRFSLAKYEQEYATRIQEFAKNVLHVPAGITELDVSMQVRFSHAAFKELTFKCGTHAHNKFVPAFVLQAGYEDIELFLEGYFSGDGCWVGKRRNAVTCSRSLAYSVAMLQRRQGRSTSVAKLRNAGDTVIRGAPAHQREAWSVMADYGQRSRSRLQSWHDEAFWYASIRKIERRPYVGPVYDAQVKGAHSMVAPWVGIHNCIFVDDMLSREAMESARAGSVADVMGQINRWIHQLVPLLSGAPDRELTFIGTRWWYGDSYEHLEESFGYGEQPQHVLLKTKLSTGLVQRLPAYRVGDLTVFRRSAIEDGQPAFVSLGEDKFGLEALAKLRMQDPELFAANYLNSPADELTATFKESWLRYYDWTEDASGDQISFTDGTGRRKTVGLGSLDVTAFVDPGGFGKNKGGDRARAAVVVVGSTTDGLHLILDIYSERGTYVQCITEFVAFVRRYGIRKTFVEIAGQQRVFFDQMKEKTKKEGLSVIFEEVPTGNKNKDDRILGLEEPFNRSTIYLGKGAKFLELKSQYSQFPKSARKDIMDALSMLPGRVRKAGGGPRQAAQRQQQELADYFRKRGITPAA